MKALRIAAVLLASALGLQGAQAAPFVSSTPATNHVVGAMEGWLEAPVYLVGAQSSPMTIQLLGFESSGTHTFSFGGSTIYEVGPGQADFFPAGAHSTLVLANPGLVPFCFGTTSGAGGSVCNGDANLPDGPSFLVSFGSNGDPVVDGATAAGGTAFILAFDAVGGPGADYDDLVIRVRLGNFVPVPEPGTLALLGLGLAGLAATRRRKR